MTRAVAIGVLLITACARDEVCLGRCGDLALGESSGGDSADASSSDGSSSDAAGSSSGDAPVEPPDEVPEGWERVCDPDDPCASLPASATFYVDHCGELGGTVFDDATDCALAFDLCLAYARQPNLGVYCMFAGIEIHREEAVAGACDEYGAPEVCISPI